MSSGEITPGVNKPAKRESDMDQGAVDMRVTLINPPRFFETGPNLGLFYVAAVLEEAGHEVAVVDKPINTIVGETWETFNAVSKNTIEEVSRTKPDVIGMTATCHTSYALELLGVLKGILPETRIVVGGPQVTFTADDVLSDYPAVDFVVRGEGEYTMLKLVNALKGDLDPAGIDGLSYRRDGRVRSNPDSPFIGNLDELPYPARHLVNLTEYPEESRITLISSRGCPHHCVFCVSPKLWRGYRPRSVDGVLEEFVYLVKEYSPRRVNFVDDTFAVGRDRTIALCRGIKEKGEGVPWSAMTRVGLGRELLEQMYTSGCRLLYFGCESGDDSTLKIVTKGITTNQIHSTVKTGLEIGLEIECSFVLNLPFETAERARTTISFAKKLKAMGAKIQAHMLFTYPGTEVYTHMGKYNLTLKHKGKELWKLASHPLYIEDRPPTPLVSNNLISEEELTKLWSEVASVFDYY
jgi:anaerobic magnesium-protoporphyrin IX monomethyl ester cyclase